jgi:hypothetical protein
LIDSKIYAGFPKKLKSDPCIVYDLISEESLDPPRNQTIAEVQFQVITSSKTLTEDISDRIYNIFNYITFSADNINIRYAILTTSIDENDNENELFQKIIRYRFYFLI